jgi:translation initiation factor 4A
MSFNNSNNNYSRNDNRNYRDNYRQNNNFDDGNNTQNYNRRHQNNNVNEQDYNNNRRGHYRDNNGYNPRRRNNNRGGRNNNFQPRKFLIDENYTEVDSLLPLSENQDLLDTITTPVDTFEDFELNEKINRGVYSYGFEHPSKIQQRGIKPIMSGYDCLIQAQSGMGKTGTYVIGSLSNIDESLNEIQAVVVAHTRELALQINSVYKNISSYSNIRTAMCVKGIETRENIDTLLGTNNDEGHKPHIIIGTPGRLLDMFNKRNFDTNEYVINANHINMFIVDEADELLGTTITNRDERTRQRKYNNNFREQLRSIFVCLKPTAQIIFISATMSEEFFHLTDNITREDKTIRILVKNEELTLDGIKQYALDIGREEYKFETLLDLYGLITVNKSIIYCNTLRGVEDLSQQLEERGYSISFIHGRMNTEQRENSMRDFRANKTNVLISTDLLSRGIDIQQVSVVINYDLPTNIENYIHRIGRSGRYGKKGVALNFTTPRTNKLLNNIERYYSTEIRELPANVDEIFNNIR